MKVLRVENLCKRYPTFLLDNVSFSLEKGRIAGLIGRNGAGKSTTLKGLLNLIDTDGEAEFFGMDMRTNERRVKDKIGYVAGGFKYYPLKKLRTVAAVSASFYPDWSEEKYRRYLSAFALDENKKVSELSEGMKVKFSIALALSRSAELLIMDEPTAGLDPLSREEFCDIILGLAGEGVSVLFSTHITSDLMRIADDIIYISGGRVLMEKDLKTVLSMYKVAFFESFAAAANCGVAVTGIKTVKNGCEGLVAAGAAPKNAVLRDADIDAIMIHLEKAKEVK